MSRGPTFAMSVLPHRGQAVGAVVPRSALPQLRQIARDLSKLLITFLDSLRFMNVVLA